MFIFNSMYDTLTLVLKPGRKLVVGAEVVREPGVRVEFVNGLYQTEDEEIAKAIRAKIKNDRTIIEVTSEDQLAFERAAKALNQRTATSALDVKGPEKVVLAEKQDLKCPICDEVLKTSQLLKVHMVNHRAQLEGIKGKDAK